MINSCSQTTARSLGLLIEECGGLDATMKKEKRRVFVRLRQQCVASVGQRMRHLDVLIQRALFRGTARKILEPRGLSNC